MHIIFGEFYRQVRDELKLRSNSLRAWPRIIHRRVYYRLIMALEQVIYSGERPRLAVISRKTHDDVTAAGGGLLVSLFQWFMAAWILPGSKPNAVCRSGLNPALRWD